MQPEVKNARLKLPEPVYRELRHLAVDRGVPVSDVILEAVCRLLEKLDRNQGLTTTKS